MIIAKGAARTMMSPKFSAFAAGKIASKRTRPALQQVIMLSPMLQAQLQTPIDKRTFSTNFVSASRVSGTDESTRILGTVTRTLKSLDSETVRKIEAELREVDTNSDGR
jgi:ribosomal protein L28